MFDVHLFHGRDVELPFKRAGNFGGTAVNEEEDVLPWICHHFVFRRNDLMNELIFSLIFCHGDVRLVDWGLGVMASWYLDAGPDVMLAMYVGMS